MDTPRPAEEHHRLRELAGHWSGEETWHRSPIHPKGKRASSRTRSRMILDGFALLQEYEHGEPGAVTYRALSILRWDWNRKEYVMESFDSMGCSRHEYRGTFENGAFRLHGAGPGGRARATMRVDGDTARIRHEICLDADSWVPLMECVNRREKEEERA